MLVTATVDTAADNECSSAAAVLLINLPLNRLKSLFAAELQSLFALKTLQSTVFKLLNLTTE